MTMRTFASHNLRNMVSDMHFIPEDDLFDEEIGEFIEECLSSSDSEEMPMENFVDQTRLESDSPQLVPSSVSCFNNITPLVLPGLQDSKPLKELFMEPSAISSSATILPSLWPLSDSSRTSYHSGEESTTGEKKVERRKRNREHAKKSRMRKKQFHEDLLVSVSLLQEENEKLRAFIRQRLGDTEASRVLSPENLQKMRLDRGSVHTARALISNKTLTLRLPEEHNKKHVTISIIG